MKKSAFNIDTPKWLLQALSFANQHETYCYLNPNNYQNGFNHLLAIGHHKKLETNELNAFESLKQVHKEASLPLFGYFSYDLKNQVEKLTSENENHTNFPLLSFFEPTILLHFKQNNEVEISAKSPQQVFNQISKTIPYQPNGIPNIDFNARTNKNTYFKNFNSIKEHIVNGDIYELNYCIEFYSTNVTINPLETYHALNKVSPTPFSSIYKSNNFSIISTSPERFIKKVNKKVISQPMKGTVKRSENPIEDIALKNQLINSEKEKAENLMIVDLVRHDLTYYANKGTVAVDELFGIYSFPKVHQMISTISIEVNHTISPIDIIQKAFPMGSMTGAPKIMAMKLIDQYEDYQRNIFSGALGYLTPDGDFDFNVLIRSLFHNNSTNYLSFSAGSAITFDANAEDEYNECLLKANSVSQCFKK